MTETASPSLQLITDSGQLAAVCARLASADFLTVDTEFHRERTYYAKLCLIQVASEEEAVLVDPLADGLDLSPLWRLLTETPVLKVMHACRQDMEIVYQHTGKLITPLFDSQLAAQLCGFGESPGYETLVNQLLKKSLDKSQQFTDWQRRPLSPRQLTYAQADVTFLRDVFRKMYERLVRDGRMEWVGELHREVSDLATYEIDPRQQWKRLRLRHAKPAMLSVLREVAAWREITAQQRNLPRQRILVDDAVLEISQQHPTTPEELMALRAMRGGLPSEWKDAILAAVRAGLALPQDEWPKLPPRPTPMQAGQEDMADVLKLLLKTKARQANLVPRLLATGDEIDALARGEHEGLACLSGWRAELFGTAALDFMQGKLTLRLDPVRKEPVWE
jgi:ribonuclease D